MNQSDRQSPLTIIAMLMGILAPIMLVIGSKAIPELFSPSAWLFTLAMGLSLPLLVVVVAVAILIAAVFLYGSVMSDFFGDSSRRLTMFGFVISAIALLFSWNQSALFGGSNILIGQIRQLPNLPFEWTWQIERWYVVFSRLLHASGLKDDQSAYLAIRLTSMFCGLATIPACAGLTVRFLKSNRSRIAALSVMLIPVLPFVCGLPLREAVLIPIIAWLCYFLLNERKRLSQLSLILAMLAFGAWFHPWALFLVPFAVISSLPLHSAFRNIAGFLLTLLGLLLVLLNRSGSIWLDRSLQSISPPTALGADWLFGTEHLMLLAQLLLLAAPCILLVVTRYSTPKGHSRDHASLFVLVFGSSSLLLLLQLPNTILLDWPRLIPLLFPIAVLSGLNIPDIHQKQEAAVTRFLVIPPFLLVASLLWILPLSKTEVGEDFATHAAERVESRWVNVGLGLRDAYFLEQEYQEATYWENQLTTRSTDYLTWRGCYDLVGTGNYTDAILELNQVLINQKNWADPRAMLSLACSRTNSPDIARAHLDTVLAFYRFDQQLLVSRYEIEMQADNMHAADSMIRAARRIFPGNLTIKTDQMIVAARLGKVGEAVARADSLLSEKPLYPAALRIRGMAAERNNQLPEAINWYQKYVENETDMSQVAAIRSKISQLTGMLPDSASSQ